MSDIQTITDNLIALQDSVIESIKTLQNAVEDLKTQQDAESTELSPFNAFLMVELTPFFGAMDSVKIVNKLDRCNKIGDYRFFTTAYRLAADDIEKRQLLKLVRATYQYKFGGHNGPSKYDLKSTIKWAQKCDHCGKLAKILYDRLLAEGLIK